MEQQLLSLIALPGQALEAHALAAPRHLYRVLDAVLADDDPEPLVGFDGDGEPQCRWVLDGAELTLVVGERGAAVLWAHDDEGDELLYREWRDGDDPREHWGEAAALFGARTSRREAPHSLPSGP